MIELRILGGVGLEGPRGTEPRAVLAQPKRLGLLIWLALAPAPRPGAVGWRRRDLATALFWPDSDTDHARASLRQALSFLRRCLGDAVVVSQGDEDIGVDPAHIACDAVRLRTAVVARDWATAARLLAGPPLEGFHVPQAAAEFDEWLATERGSLQATALDVYRTLSAELAAAGDPDGAVRAARAAVATAPADEAAAAQLIALLDRQGNRAAALASYEELRQRLAADYDAEPSPETQALARRIRSRVDSDLIGADADQPAEARPPSEHWVAPVEQRATGGRRVRSWRGLLTLGITILAVAVIAAGSRTLVGRPRGRPAPALDPPSIAVADLTNATGDTTMAFLTAGIGEALRGGLLGSGKVAVIPLRRIADTGSAEVSLTAASDRGADAVLEGELARSAGELALEMRLVDAKSARTIWSERYRLPLSRLLEVQDQVTTAVLQRLRVATGGEMPRRGTSSVAAHMDYLRGMYANGERTPEAFLRGRDLFLRAIAEDPTYAAAYVGLSGAYQGLAHYGAVPAGEAFPRSEAAARRALEIDSALAGGYMGLAAARSFHDWDWPGAERLYRRALQLDPGDPAIHNFYGIHLRVQGRFDEAAEQMRIAAELDPLARIYVRQLGLVHYCAGRFDAALREFRRAAAMDPGYAEARRQIVQTLGRLGRYDEALAAWREGAGSAPAHVRTVLERAKGESGYRAAERVDAAIRLASLDALPPQTYVPPGARMLLHARLGHWNDALAWLERAADERDPLVLKIACEQELEPIRTNPRYQAVVRRTGLDRVP